MRAAISMSNFSLLPLGSSTSSIRVLTRRGGTRDTAIPTSMIVMITANLAQWGLTYFQNLARTFLFFRQAGQKLPFSGSSLPHSGPIRASSSSRSNFGSSLSLHASVRDLAILENLVESELLHRNTSILAFPASTSRETWPTRWVAVTFLIWSKGISTSGSDSLGV